MMYLYLYFIVQFGFYENVFDILALGWCSAGTSTSDMRKALSLTEVNFSTGFKPHFLFSLTDSIVVKKHFVFFKGSSLRSPGLLELRVWLLSGSVWRMRNSHSTQSTVGKLKFKMQVTQFPPIQGNCAAEKRSRMDLTDHTPTSRLSRCSQNSFSSHSHFSSSSAFTTSTPLQREQQKPIRFRGFVDPWSPWRSTASSWPSS